MNVSVGKYVRYSAQKSQLVLKLCWPASLLVFDKAERNIYPAGFILHKLHGVRV